MTNIILNTLAIAILSFGFGWSIGYAQGRRIGYMIGEELERRRHASPQ